MHWVSRLVILFFCIAAFNVRLSAKSPFVFEHALEFQPFRPAGSISMGIVVDITQDSLGRIWLASSEGLYRYDGMELEHYFHNSEDALSLNSNVCSALLIDSNGELWIGSEGGLNKYMSHTDNFRNYPIKEADGDVQAYYVTSMVEDASRKIWISTLDSGIYCFDPIRESFQALRSLLKDGERYLAEHTRGIYISSDSTFWIGTSTFGVQFFNTRTFQLQVLPLGSADGKHMIASDIRNIIEDHKGRMWFGSTTQGITQYTPQTGSYRYFRKEVEGVDAIPSNTVWDFTLDMENQLWVCTDGGGILSYSEHEEKFTAIQKNPRKSSPGSDVVRTLFEDRLGDFWLGYYDAPVDFVHRGKKKFYKAEDIFGVDYTSLQNHITSVFEDSFHGLWMGTDGFGILHYDPFDARVMQYRKSPNSQGFGFHKPLCFSEDSEGNIWTGYYEGGISCFVRKQGRFTYFSTDGSDLSPHAKQIWGIHATDDAVWIATEMGIEYMDRQTGVFSAKIDTGGGYASIIQGAGVIKEDSKGRILFGTHGGLFVYHTIHKSLQHYMPIVGDSTSLSDPWVVSIFEDATKRIWLGTYGGALNRWDGYDTFISYSHIAGLQGTSVKAVQGDRNGILWLTTNVGISSFDPRTEDFTNYHIKDIISEGNFFPNASYLGTDNTLYFGSNRGLVYFNPSDIKLNSQVPSIAITHLSVTGLDEERALTTEEIQRTHELRIQSGLETVRFHFALQQYVHADRVRYKYMLEGHDPSWIENSGKGFVHYSNLNPGSYTFKVKACNEDQFWSPQPAQFVIVVRPPWYRQNWFVVLLISALIAIMYRWYVGRRTKWLDALEQVRQQLDKRSEELVQRNIEIEEQTSKITRQRDVATSQRDQIIKQKEELEEHRNRLEELVDERTQDLVAAKEMAEASDRLKTAFLENLSHQIRTPMNAILGFINLLTEKIDDVVSRDYYLSIINESGRNMLVMIHDIIDFAKMQAGELQPEYTECNASTIIRELVTGIRERMARENTGINILTELPEEDELMYSDETKLRQIFAKLFDNALGYTSNGYIKAGIREKTQETITFYVEDTGHGFNAGEEEAVFDRFYSTQDISNAQDNKGSGLGLAFTKVAVELLGGKIWAERNSQGGSSFIFSLPYMQVSAQAQPRVTAAPESYDWSSKRILVAEDEDSNFLLIEAILRDTKVELTHVADGVELLELIDKGEKEFDLILLDLKMPRMGGINAMKIIRESDKDTPVIVQTAYDQNHHRDQCVEFGCNDFLVKPLRKRELLTAVKKYLG